MSESDAGPTSLLDFVPARDSDGNRPDGDAMLDGFLAWAEASGISLYPAQEEAVLEIMGGRHVVLNTPTGSGKSLVATAMHFRSLCEGLRSVYTCPIKALVSEKFFEACNLFGADNVGMVTGDASINRDAPILCCTAEILANMALSDGEKADVDYVIMDEFHYYSDPERGMAWQLPLLTLRNARFLLMSATLGDIRVIEEGLTSYTGREVTHVRSSERPVPLDFVYRETPLHETLEELVSQGKTPIYVVNFTQRECAELAQSLTSTNFSSKEEKAAIKAEIGDFRFDSPYGKEMKRYVFHGIGLHHAGLLPRYRRLVERLAQAGHMKVICGTDTLGVGINVPIRAVVFSKLCKFDGEKVGLLSVRDFKQIAGRAGRKGFDDEGTVVCQAPEHVIENRKIQAKQAANPGSKKKLQLKKPPEKGFAPWDEKTFDRLQRSDPEALTSRMRITHGMLIQLLSDTAKHVDEEGGGYATLMGIIDRCHERPARREELKADTDALLDSLKEADVIEEVEREAGTARLRINIELQEDFSLLHTLSLYLVDAIERVLDDDDYALNVLSLVESVLENPNVVLFAQERKAKGDLINQLKAEGVEYDDRMAQLETVSWPKPNADFIYETFNEFRAKQPWVGDNVRPKSVVRDLYERYLSFPEYIREYGLARSEGVLLRYLSETYKTLLQTVPEGSKTDQVVEILAFLRAMLERIDSSLVQEWEALADPKDPGAAEAVPVPLDISRDTRSFQARIRQELHALVRALSAEDYEEAAACVHPESDLDAREMAEALASYREAFGELVFDHRSRMTDKTTLAPKEKHLWTVRQTLLDPQDENMWFIEGEIDLREDTAPEGMLVRLRRIAD